MNHADNSNEVYFNRTELANYLRCSKNSIPTWDCRGTYDFKPIKIGKKMVLYRKSVIDALLRELNRP